MQNCNELFREEHIYLFVNDKQESVLNGLCYFNVKEKRWMLYYTLYRIIASMYSV